MSNEIQPKPPAPQPSDQEPWLKLAEQASKELDPSKLSQLVRQLCDELDERAAHLGPKKPSLPDDPTKPLDITKPHA